MASRETATGVPQNRIDSAGHERRDVPQSNSQQTRRLVPSSQLEGPTTSSRSYTGAPSFLHHHHAPPVSSSTMQMQGNPAERILQRLKEIEREEQAIARAQALLIQQQEHATSQADSKSTSTTTTRDNTVDGRHHYAPARSHVLSPSVAAAAGLSSSLSQSQERFLSSLGKEGRQHANLRLGNAHPSDAYFSQQRSSLPGPDQDASSQREGGANEDHEAREEESSNNKMMNRVTFPLKLYSLLQNAEQEGHEHIISWRSHGQAFKVHNMKQFVADIMPKYFAGGKFNTFQKQLNLYAFKRVASGPDKGSYFHKDFVKGQPDLCQRINRRKTTTTTTPRAEHAIPTTDPSSNVKSTTETGRRIRSALPLHGYNSSDLATTDRRSSVQKKKG